MRRMTRMTRMAVVAAAAVALAACGGDDDGGGDDGEGPTDAISVVGTEALAFEPDAFTVAAGEEVTVELDAQGVEHDFNIEDAADVGSVGEMVMDSGVPEGDLHVVHSDAGTTESGTFTMDEAGTYTVYCSVPGHREAGMEATLEVVSG